MKTQVTFFVQENSLEDKSITHDVYMLHVDGSLQLVDNSPSARTAENLAVSLNKVLQTFADLGSDQAAVRLSFRIFEACNLI